MPKVNEDYPGKELTDEQLKAQVINQSFVDNKTESNNKPTEKSAKYPTEIINLPSQGLLYPEDNPLSSGKIEMKYMTAKEEDILTSQNLIKKGLVIDQLLRSLIVSPINYNDLLVGDKNAIMVAARVLGYGGEYPVEITCPECGTKSKIEVNLTELKDKPIDPKNYTKGQNRFTTVLPASKRTIEWKLLTHSDEAKVAEMTKSIKKRSLVKTVDPQMSTRFKNMILSVDNDETQATINKFVDQEFLSRDTMFLRKEIEKLSPDIDMTFDFECPECGHEVPNQQIPMNVQFFWPRG